MTSEDEKEATVLLRRIQDVDALPIAIDAVRAAEVKDEDLSELRDLRRAVDAFLRKHEA